MITLRLAVSVPLVLLVVVIVVLVWLIREVLDI